MVKKNKSKKHLGHKDPYKQAEERFNKIRNKVDCPPENADEQALPNRLKNLFNPPKISEDFKPEKLIFNGKIDTKGLEENRSDRNKKGKYAVKSAIPQLKQGEHESNRDFMFRFKQVTQSLRMESSFKSKYNVDTEKDEKGNIVGWTKREGTVQTHGKKVLSAKKIQDRLDKKRLKNRERMHKRKNRLKKRTLNNDSDEEESMIKHNMYVKDNVRFGEVVNAPPKLTTAHKLQKKVIEKEATPAGRGFLFAKSLEKDVSKKNNPQKPNKEKSIKAKFLEKERMLAVNAYRELRNKQKDLLT